MKKPMLSIVALGAATAAAVAGCGTGTATSNSSSVSTNGKVTITEMDFNTTSSASAAFNSLINQFEKSHPNITIQRTTVPASELLPKSLQEATTHTLPTIIATDNLNVPTMVAAGALASLSNLGTIDKSKFLAGPLKTVTVNGQLYGLPVGNNDLALIYNKTMFQKANLTPPRTWAQLLTDSKKLSHGSTYGLAFSATTDEENMWQFAPFVWSNGGSFTKLDSPQATKALQLWMNLVKQHGAAQSVVNFSQDDVYNEFAAGRAAMMEMGPWILPTLQQTKIQYGVVPMPTPALGEHPISPIGEAWTISSDGSKQQQQAAWTFINWIQQKDVLAKFDNQIGNIPAYKPATDLFVSKQPDMKVFADELQYAKPLFDGLGPNLPKVSDDVSTAVQSALSGQQSPQSAAKSGASAIASVLHP